MTSTSSPIASASGDLIIADHTVVDQFNQIPDEYIQKASQLHLLFRHASVGWNISEALDCMAQNYSGSRPNFCDRGLSAGQIIANPKYDRSNWIFEFHAPPPGQNPGWWNKVQFFLDRVNNLGPNEHFDVATFKLGYVDADNGSNLDDIFFHNDPNDNFPSIDDLLALEAAHPDLKLMYMTLALAKSIGSPDSASFDQQMRDFASANHKILFDIADIESHSPDGAPCFDNHGGGIEALCDEYTQEKNAGHLNALGSQRVAKALWWMMARLAGMGWIDILILKPGVEPVEGIIIFSLIWKLLRT